MIQSVEEAIFNVEQLYTSITGVTPPTSHNGPYAPIPPEKDPGEYVEESMARLTELLRTDSRPLSASLPTWTPAADLSESDNEYVVSVDLPGVERGELEVTLERSLLTISGIRSTFTNGLALRHAERPRGRFFRQIVIPGGARSEEAVARLAGNGTLEIRVPKALSSQEQRRTIEVS